MMRKEKNKMKKENKGIIYVMSTAVRGLIKIGSTDDFENRMYKLESDGYFNVSGLKRKFAIEVDDYQAKEKLLDSLFLRSRVADSELFSLDINQVIQLLSSFEGTVIWPKEENKEEIFDNATEAVSAKSVSKKGIKNVLFYFSKNGKTFGTMEIKNGKFTLKAGSALAPLTNSGKDKGIDLQRNNLKLDDSQKTLEDFSADTPSYIASLVSGNPENGWEKWKDINGKPLSLYRDKIKS